MSPCQTVAAVVSQLQLHFWSMREEIIYLASVPLVDASLDEDPCQFVHWHPFSFQFLTCITSRRVLFFDLDFTVPTQELLRPAAGKSETIWNLANITPGIKYKGSVKVPSGLVNSIAPAGKDTFFLCTTSGMVYIIDWSVEQIVQGWNVVHISEHLTVLPQHNSGRRESIVTPTALVPPTDGSAVARSPLLSAEERRAIVLPYGIIKQTKRTPSLIVQDEAQESKSPLPGSVVAPSASSGGFTTTTTTTTLAASSSAGASKVERQRSELTESSASSHSNGRYNMTPIDEDDMAFSSLNSRPSYHTRQDSTDDGAYGALPVLGGTLLHVSCSIRIELISFVLSSGHILLTYTSSGLSFRGDTQPVSFRGFLNAVPSASSSSINSVHNLLAVATHSGNLNCYLYDRSNLRLRPCPWWRKIRALEECKTKRGPITCMQWSKIDEDMLCVGFYKLGVMVFHYSGVCVMMSSAESSPPFRTPFSEVQCCLKGCVFSAWAHNNFRLLAIEPHSSSFVSVAMMRSVVPSEVGPSYGVHTPLALLSSGAIHLTGFSQVVRQPGIRETSPAPRAYLEENYPLRFAAISSDGAHVVCAGSTGFLYYNCCQGSWAVCDPPKQRPNPANTSGTHPLADDTFGCVADPTWLSHAIIVVPAYEKRHRRFELLFFSRWNVDSRALLCSISLQHRPVRITSTTRDARSDGFLVVYDVQQFVTIYHYDLTLSLEPKCTQPALVQLTAVRTIRLGRHLSYNLQIRAFCDDGIREGAVRVQDAPHLLFHRYQDHCLAVVHSQPKTWSGKEGRTSATQTIVQEDELCIKLVAPLSQHSSNTNSNSNSISNNNNGESLPKHAGNHSGHVFFFCVDRSTPLDGTSLLTFEDDSVYLQHFKKWAVPDKTAFAMTKQHIANVKDTGRIPLMISPFDTTLLCALEATESTVSEASHLALRAHGMPLSTFALAPVLYTHRVLAAALASALPSRASSSSDGPAPGSGPNNADHLTTGQLSTFVWDRQLLYWLQKLRETGLFVPTMDFFLQSVIDEKPPAGIPFLNRRNCIQAAIKLLRSYPEALEIIVGCVRKVDVSRWHLILDFLGSPTELYKECLTNQQFVESMHLVRVIMMANYHVSADAAKGSAEPATATSAPLTADSPEEEAAAAASLEQGIQCTLQLITFAIRNRDFVAAYDLLRFLALLGHQLSLPTSNDIHDVDNTTGALSFHRLEGMLAHLLARRNRRSGQTSSPTPSEEASTPLTARYASLQFVDRDGVEQSDGAVQQRGVPRQVSVLRDLFALYHQVPEAIEKEAVRLLRDGLLLQLVMLLETFSLSTEHFLQTQWHTPSLRGDGAQHDGEEEEERDEAVEQTVRRVLGGLHTELGLPHSAHPVSHSWPENQDTFANCFPVPAAAGAAEAQLYKYADKQLWSEAQCLLYGNSQLFRCAYVLKELFSGHPLYALCFDLLLMISLNVLEWMLQQDSATANQTICAERAAILEKFANEKPWKGYKGFVESVILALPPSFLKENQPTK